MKTLQDINLVLVDDEPDILVLLEYYFKRLGAYVTTFSDGTEAIAYVQSKKPSLIISDWMMPEMNGLEFCAEVRKNPTIGNVPFILLTCKDEESDKQKAYSYGVDEFLSKPIRLNIIADTVNRLLTRGDARLQGTV